MEPGVMLSAKSLRFFGFAMPLLTAGFWVGLIGWWTLGFTAFTATSHTFNLAGPLPRQAASLALVNHQGHFFSLIQPNGPYRLVYFHFLSCRQICPLLHSRHLEILRSLPPVKQANLELLAISVDPADTPDNLWAHLRHLDSPPNLVMAALDGPQPQSLQALGVSVVRKADGSYNHPAFSFLINPQGKMVLVVDGNTPPAQAARRIEKELP